MKKNTLLTIGFCFLFISNFLAETYYVKATGNNTTGLDEANAFTTVNNARNAASDGDTIIIVGTITQTGQVIIDKSLNFQGQSAIIKGVDNDDPDPEVIPSTRLYRVTAAGLTITFNDITFQGSKNKVVNGSVLSLEQASTVSFTDCIFDNNSTTANGGAVYVNHASASFTAINSVFKNNSAGNYAGAIYAGAGATLTLTGSTFYSNNGGGIGGAVYANESGTTGTATNCTFFKNSITNTDVNFGAAIRSNSATFTIINSLIYDNTNGNNLESGFHNNPASVSTVTNSLIGKANNVDSPSASSLTADLDGSNLVWNETLNKVTFSAPNAITDLDIAGKTPINFGSDGNDVGAWEGSAINIFLGGTPGALEGWANDANWSKGSQPEATDNVAILTGRNSTLPASTTVNDIKVTSLLRINSNQGLVVNGDAIVTGTVRYSRALTNNADNTKAWHLVASPVADEVFDTSYLDINDIAVGTNSNRGIATYNTGDNSWSYYTGVDITTTSGQGYSMKITPDGITNAGGAGEYADGFVVFEGTLNDTDVTTPALAAGFNLLGNPYTSFVNSGVFLTDAANSAAGIDKTQMWVWNSSTENYDVKTVGEAFVLAPAQGFFVNSTNTAAVTFSKTNQATTGGAFQKTARTEIKLLMNTSTNERFAKIYLTDTATKGFDSGWEGEVFGGIANKVDVFTELVSDNQGKNYQVQSLPISEMESMVIPVGVIAEAGKELTFSLEQTNFPTDVKVYLEDRVANTYNELTNSKTFKVTLSEALNDVGRFYLHASKSPLSVDDNVVSENISMYKSNATTLKVVGLPNGTSNIKLFNILGKQVLNTSFIANGVKEITLPKLAIGVYIVQLETETSKLNKKIIIE